MSSISNLTFYYPRCLNRKLDNVMAPKNESGSSTLKTNESPSDESQTAMLAGDTARNDETGAVISRQRGDNTDQADQADTTSLIGVAIMCLLLTLGGSHISGHNINYAD